MQIENHILLRVDEKDIDENGKVTVPPGVKEIARDAFNNLDDMLEVSLPSTVEIIGNGAFMRCDGLSTIKLPQNLKVIEDMAFSGCSNLERIDIPDSVSEIGTDAFLNCESLTFAKLPSSLKEIPGHIFENCYSLGSVVIPEGVETIFSNAFARCSSLSSVKLPTSLKTIGAYAFSSCSAFTNLNIPNSVSEINVGAFSGCSSLETVHLPEGLNKIDNTTFSSCESLKHINIPKTVQIIGTCAFAFCPNLESVVIPENVMSLGNSVFAKCDRLKSVTLPSKILAIGDNTFADCFSLKEIKLPDSLKSIGNRAFTRTSLESIDIPDGVRTMGEGAFGNCVHLASVHLPTELTELNHNVFENCYALSKVEVPENVKHIKGSFVNSGIEKITLPEGLVTIGDDAFNECNELKEINIPSTVTRIGDSSFKNCSQLKSIDIPDSVTVIDNNAFERSGLTKIFIPDSVETVGTSAFSYCDDLTSVRLSNSLTNISENMFSFCGELERVDIPDSVKTIDKCAFRFCYELKEANLPKNLKTIGQSAFRSCTSLSKLIIPEGVTEIGKRALFDCESLTHIHFPNSLKLMTVSSDHLRYFEKCETGFNLLAEPTPTSIPVEKIQINFPFLSRNWEYHQMLFNEQKSPTASSFYNEYLCKQSDETIKKFLAGHNFTFLKKFNLDNLWIDNYKTFNCLFNLGVMNPPTEVNGKKIDYAQKISNFLYEKIRKKSTSLFSLVRSLENMQNQGFKKDFSDFLMNNFDELMEEVENHPHFLERCYNEFEIVQATNTNNHGEQRQLKPTIEKFRNYFNKNKFSGITPELEPIANTVAKYFDDQRYFDSAVSIERERRSRRTPNNILAKPLSEKTVFAEIDNYADKIEKLQRETLANLVKASGSNFSFEWLEKNDPENFILGKLCSCCAHLGGVGYGIMHASIVDPFVQNLVIRNKSGKIVAKSTLYINPRGGYGVFNNVEVNTQVSDEDKEEIYKKYIIGVRTFAEQYNREHPDRPLKQINVGMHLNDLEEQLNEYGTESKDLFEAIDYGTYGIDDQDYSGDSDEEQYVVWKAESSVKDFSGKTLV